MRLTPPLTLTRLEPREVPDATPVVLPVIVAPADTVREAGDAGGKIDDAQRLKIQLDRPFEVKGKLTMQPGSKPKERRADIDMYKFDVRAGQVIGFDVVRGQGTPDLLVRVIGPGVDISHGFAERPASRSPLLLHRFEQAGTYTLIVTALRNDNFNFRTGDTLVVKQGQRADGLTGGYAIRVAPTDVTAVSAEVVPGSGLRVNYRLGGYGLNAPLFVGVYRSASPVFDRATAELVKHQSPTSAYEDDGKPGDHQFNVALFPNEGATAARPYLFVAVDDPPIPYATVGAGAGRFRESDETDNVVLVGGLADVRTTAAFTEDGSAVTVRYAVANAALLTPIRFGLYRSASLTFERAGAELIGTAAPGTDAAGRPAQDLGGHEVKLSFGQPPRGTAEKPYLFVLADVPTDPTDPSPVGAVMEPREDNNAQPLGRITLAQLSAVMGRDRRGQPDASLDQYLDAVNRTFGEFGIITYKRQAAFLGQVRHETGGLSYMKEAGWTSDSYQKSYYLKMYGPNAAKPQTPHPEVIPTVEQTTSPGPGYAGGPPLWYLNNPATWYIGRGMIQLTGIGNYEKAWPYLFGQQLTASTDLSRVERVPLDAARAGGCFWSELHNLNAVADRYVEGSKDPAATAARVSNDISKVVNSRDKKTFPDRLRYYQLALSVLRPSAAVARDLPLDPPDTPADPPPVAVLPGAVSGFVYVDADDDGVKDAGEAGIAGARVVLHGANVGLTAVTDANGFYRFGGLVGPGPYTLTELQPAGYLDGRETAGTLGGVGGNDTISGIPFAAGRESVNNNFGERPVPPLPTTAPAKAAPQVAAANDAARVAPVYRGATLFVGKYPRDHDRNPATAYQSVSTLTPEILAKLKAEGANVLRWQVLAWDNTNEIDGVVRRDGESDADWAARLGQWQQGMTTPQGYAQWVQSQIEFLRQSLPDLKKNKVKVIINLHVAPLMRPDQWGGKPGQGAAMATLFADTPAGEVSRKAFFDAWAAFSKAFRDEPAVVGYDLMNEPDPFAGKVYQKGSDGKLTAKGEADHKADARPAGEKISALMGEAIRRLRESGDRKRMIVESWGGSPGGVSHLETVKDRRGRNDPNVEYSFHIYWSYSGGADHLSDNEVRSNLNAVARWQANQSTKNGPVKVFVGEWGTGVGDNPTADDLARAKKYLATTANYFNEKGWDWAYFELDRDVEKAKGGQLKLKHFDDAFAGKQLTVPKAPASPPAVPKSLPELAEPPVSPPVSPSPLETGRSYSFASANFPDRAIRHRNFEAWLDQRDASDLFAADSGFVARPGLADPSLVSFESVNFPGRFLRHREMLVHLDANDGSDLFNRDATFRVVPGLNGAGVSFEAVNFPGHFIRHEHFRLKIAADDGSVLFKNDATFSAVPMSSANPPPAASPPTAAPSELRAENVWARAADVRWNAAGGAVAEYRIAVSRDGVNWDNAGVVGADTTSFRLTGLAPNTRLWVKVRASGPGGYSDYTNVIDITTRDEPPAAPANLRAANVWARAVDLNWDDRSGNETEFRVAISRDGGATWDNVGVTGANVTRLRVENLRPNTRYLFKVRAANAEGYSEYTNVIDLTTRKA